jgi:hypothetical protein
MLPPGEARPHQGPQMNFFCSLFPIMIDKILLLLFENDFQLLHFLNGQRYWLAALLQVNDYCS